MERKRPVFARRPVQFPSRDTRSRTNQNTLPPGFLSQAYHEVEVCRGREVSEAKVTMGPFFESSADIIWRVPARERSCEYWHPPECQFLKKKWNGLKGWRQSGCFRITRLMNNQIKKAERGANSQKKRESDDKNAVAIVKSVSQLGCVSQDSDALVSQGRKSRGNPMQTVLEHNSNGTIHQVDATSCEYPGKERTIVGKNKCQRSSSAKFTTLWNLRTGPMKRLNDSSDVPEARLGLVAKNMYKLKEKKTRQHSTFPRRNGHSRRKSTKEPEEREFVVDSGTIRHMVGKRDLNSAELDTMRTSRSPTTVMTANGEVQTREEETVCVKQLDLLVRVMLLEETPALLFLGKLCEDHGYTFHWISGQKPHLTKKGKRTHCSFSNYVPFVVPGLSTSSSTTPSPTSSSSSSQDSEPFLLKDCWLRHERPTVGFGTCTRGMTVPSCLSSEMHLQNSLTKHNVRADKWISEQKFAQRLVIKGKGCGQKWETQRDLTQNKYPPHYQKWRNRLTWKTQTVWRPFLRLEFKIHCLRLTRWKRSSCNNRHHPGVVVTILETDAFVAFVAYTDMLMVRSNLSAGSRKRGTQRKVAILRRKRPRLCISKLRSKKVYSTESWRIGIERFGGKYLKFSGCTWYKIEFLERKGQSGGIFQNGEPHERNPCAPGFEEWTIEETSWQADCDSKVARNLEGKMHNAEQERFLLR